jgi:hypothetical protein
MATGPRALWETQDTAEEKDRLQFRKVVFRLARKLWKSRFRVLSLLLKALHAVDWKSD